MYWLWHRLMVLMRVLPTSLKWFHLIKVISEAFWKSTKQVKTITHPTSRHDLYSSDSSMILSLCFICRELDVNHKLPVAMTIAWLVLLCLRNSKMSSYSKPSSLHEIMGKHSGREKYVNPSGIIHITALTTHQMWSDFHLNYTDQQTWSA